MFLLLSLHLLLHLDSLPIWKLVLQLPTRALSGHVVVQPRRPCTTRGRGPVPVRRQKFGLTWHDVDPPTPATHFVDVPVRRRVHGLAPELLLQIACKRVAVVLRHLARPVVLEVQVAGAGVRALGAASRRVGLELAAGRVLADLLDVASFLAVRAPLVFLLLGNVTQTAGPMAGLTLVQAGHGSTWWASA